MCTQVWCFKITLEKDAAEKLKKVEGFGQCTPEDVGVLLYENEYCTGYPANDNNYFYRYNAGSNGPNTYIFNKRALNIRSIRPSVLLPCTGGKGWTVAPGESATSHDSRIGIKVVLWPGEEKQVGTGGEWAAAPEGFVVSHQLPAGADASCVLPPRHARYHSHTLWDLSIRIINTE
jgi:hypothetical protein